MTITKQVDIDSDTGDAHQLSTNSILVIIVSTVSVMHPRVALICLSHHTGGTTNKKTRLQKIYTLNDAATLSSTHDFLQRSFCVNNMSK